MKITILLSKERGRKTLIQPPPTKKHWILVIKLAVDRASFDNVRGGNEGNMVKQNMMINKFLIFFVLNLFTMCKKT